MKGPEAYENLLTEVRYKATTSGGKGGQHVNKVATRIELYFDVATSSLLTEKEKNLLLKKLSGKINDDGVLRIISSEERTQYKNKKLANKKFLELISKSLHIPKKRKPSQPTESSIEERLREKKLISDKKKRRQLPD